MKFTKEELKSILGFCDASIQCELDAASDFDNREYYLEQAKNWKSIKRKIKKALKGDK